MTTPSGVSTRIASISRLAARLADWLDAWLDAYLPRLRRHRPRVRIAIGPWLPGWTIRLVLAASVVGLAALADAGVVAWIAVFVIATLIAFWPAGVPSGSAVIVLSLVLVVADEAPSPLLLAIYIAGLSALVQIGAVVGRTSWFARIELAALLAPLPRFCVIQAFVQPLGLLAGLLTARNLVSGTGAVLFPILAVVGLGVLSYLWLPRLDRRE